MQYDVSIIMLSSSDYTHSHTLLLIAVKETLLNDRQYQQLCNGN